MGERESDLTAFGGGRHEVVVWMVFGCKWAVVETGLVPLQDNLAWAIG